MYFEKYLKFVHLNDSEIGVKSHCVPLFVGNTFLSEIKALDILFKSLWLFISFLMEKESLPYFRCQQLVGRVVDICPKADSPSSTSTSKG